MPPAARPGAAGPRLVLLGGSTASGKSALALAVAAATGAAIVNADSQQLFADLPTLTARPGPADLARAEHRLYGVLGAAEQPSAGRWLALLAAAWGDLAREGRPVVLVGGTGLYFHVLLRGLAPVPPVPPGLRERLAGETEAVPTPALHGRLAALDPATAARVRSSDRQRVLRALEVVIGTGRPLAEWQALRRERPDLPAPSAAVALVPEPALVAARIEARLEGMLAAGALEEVRALAAARPDLPSLPIAKVHGARELLAVAEGRSTPAEARAGIAAQIRQYAKRQRTFFRHQLAEFSPIVGTGETVDPSALLPSPPA